MMRQTTFPVGAFVFLLLTLVVSACGGTNPVAPSSAGPAPVPPTPTPVPPVTQSLDMLGLSEGARNFVLTSNINAPFYGAVTIWPARVPIQVFAEDLRSESKPRITQFWRDVTGGGVILEFVDSDAQAANGIRLYHALPPDRELGLNECGLAGTNRVQSNIIRQATGWSMIGLRSVCMDMSTEWQAILYAHEIGHSLGISGHNVPPGEIMSLGSSKLIASAMFREAMTWLYQQPPGSKP